jgi:hypothetical protein
MKRLPSVRKQDKQMAQIAQARDLAWKTTLDARDQRDARRKAANGGK